MSNSKNITVLYVDDEEINLFLFKATFASKYQVITALSGPEGLRKLDGHHNEIIVVISDMKMPLMDGLVFIQQAKAKYLHIAYFILTAYEFDERIEEALRNNVIQKFFTKPFDVPELEGAIEKAAQLSGQA